MIHMWLYAEYMHLLGLILAGLVGFGFLVVVEGSNKSGPGFSIESLSKSSGSIISVVSPSSVG